MAVAEPSPCYIWSFKVTSASGSPARSPRFERLKHWYFTLSTIVFVTLLLLVGVNIALYFFTPHETPNPLSRYGLATILRAYPGWDKDSVLTLLKETYQGRNYEHHPFAQFKNGPFLGRYLSISPPGFRVVKNQAPWPPRSSAYNIFVFGGSTAFGLGVTNEETIASFLQEILNSGNGPRPVAVYNFGTPAYASRQEATLYYDFLTSGVTPDMAVFIDGLNEMQWGETPALTTEISRFVEGKAFRDFLYANIPMVRLAYSVLHRRVSAGTDVGGGGAAAEGVIQRWMYNKRVIEAMAAAFGVRTLFVWQPVPYYNYDLQYHIFCQARPDCKNAAGSDLYSRMKTVSANGQLGGDYLWLGDVQAGRTDNLYVDNVHYNPAFSREIAQLVAERIRLK
jgi:hypothetical protein